jgi:menaquinone-dependent protoporphyrinogen IX oxidase
MKTLVIYKTKAGHTKRYAEMIAQAIEAEPVSIKKAVRMDVSDYPLLIYGGGLHAVGIDGYKTFKHLVERNNVQNWIVFAVGASPNKDGIIEEIKRNNFFSPEEQNIPLFYLRGGFDYSKLPVFDKLLMLLLKIKLHMKKQRTPDESGLLASYKTPLDTVKSENIRGIVDYIKTRDRSE